MASRPRTSRRRWSDTFKKRVVAEVSQPGVKVVQIAHRYELDARRISNWKTKFGSGAVLVRWKSQRMMTTCRCHHSVRLS
jgi:transposase-like protein